jgi:TRAP-type C4-dicarboxylate transport system permease small subunit
MSPLDNPISRYVEPAARLAAILFGYAVLAYALLLSFEIVSRKLFNSSFKGIDELGGFVLAISAAIGASYTMALRGHTRVDVFLVRMPKTVQAWLNALAMVSMAGFAGFSAWRGVAVLLDTIEFGSVSPNLQQPLWIPQLIWVAGLVLFAAIAMLYGAHALYLLVTGRPEINTLYGPLSVDDELDTELEALKSRKVEGSDG